jgi:hypothetical protein
MCGDGQSRGVHCILEFSITIYEEWGCPCPFATQHRTFEELASATHKYEEVQLR